MTVWILQGLIWYEGDYVLGVFKTEKEAIEAQKACEEGKDSFFHYEDYLIGEYTIGNLVTNE